MTSILGSEQISVYFDTFLRLRQFSQDSSSVSGNFSSSKYLLRHSSKVTLFKFSGLTRFTVPIVCRLCDLVWLLRLYDLCYCVDSSPSGRDNMSSVSYLYFGFWHERQVMQSPTIPWNISVMIDWSRSSSAYFTALKYSFLSTLVWSVFTNLCSIGWSNLGAVFTSSFRPSNRQERNSCTSYCSLV